MATRRRPPLPDPPLLAGIAVDGSNVIATATAGAARRLELALVWCAAFATELPVVVFVDASTLGRCPAELRARLLARQAETRAADRVRWEVGPRGGSVDARLLQHARDARSLVLSNDRFADHDELRRGVITLQFECRGATFAPHAEATWFTPAGGACRLAVNALRR